ncbi:hypothetical protein AB4K20DRAFT_1866951 [Rhizopus microsporus]|uniref:Uncharacterized protein n=1 Tax=Rhizopus microsporus TaxID=58291 RepID=A0A1X0S4A3_RHIZD|nr:hypothetical protein BCV71DRAFT_234487 [Rhizopus microsporus]
MNSQLRNTAIRNFTITRAPLLTIKNNGAMSVKINIEGGTFGVQLVSHHAGIIEYILKNFSMNTVHSVQGHLGIGSYRKSNGNAKHTAYITIKEVYTSSIIVDENEVDEPERVIFCFKYALENWSKESLVIKKCNKKDIINNFEKKFRKLPSSSSKDLQKASNVPGFNGLPITAVYCLTPRQV